MTDDEAGPERNTPVRISGSDLTTDQYIALLSETVSEEHYYIGSFHREVQFFWGIISALAVASAVAVYNQSRPLHLVLAGSAALLAVPVTVAMRKEIERTYKRFIEVIAVRAKLEQVIGLNRPLVFDDGLADYWDGEPILHPGHIESRKDFPASSSAFVEERRSQGLMGVYARATKVIGVAAAAVAVGLFVWAGALATTGGSESDEPQASAETL